MMCEWHGDCGRIASGRIKTPYGFLWSCREGISEYREMHGLAPKFESSLTKEEIASLKLTKDEKRELAELSRKERDEVLHFLLRMKSRRKRRINSSP